MTFVVFNRQLGKYYKPSQNSGGYTTNPRRAKKWPQIDYAMKIAHAKNLSHQARKPDETPFVVRQMDEEWNVIASFEDPEAIAPKRDEDETDQDREAMSRKVRHRPKPPWHSD